jgi:hypothetical protein
VGEYPDLTGSSTPLWLTSVGGRLLAISMAVENEGVRYRLKNDTCWNRRPARICSTRASDSDPIRSPRRALSTDEI